MMRIEEAGTVRYQTLGRHRTIGNPDAFVVEIHNPGFGLASGFPRGECREKRAVEKGQLASSRRDWEWRQEKMLASLLSTWTKSMP